MPRALPIALAIALASLAIGSPARAQRTLDIERFTPAPDGDGFLTIPGTRTPGPWRWNLALFGGYEMMPLTARLPEGPRIGLVSDRAHADLLLQVGILGRFAIVIDAPIVLYQAGSPEVLDAGDTLQPVALRDPRIAIRARVLGEDATEERQRHEGEGVAIQIAGTVPIGLEQSFAGEGAPQLEAQLIGDFHLLDLGVAANLGFRHRFAEPTVLAIPFRNQLFFGFGVQVPLFFVDDVLALAEVNTTTDAENAFGQAASTAVDWLLGVRGRLRDLELTLAGGTGLTGGVGTTTFRLVAGISWAPRTHDRDHDGIGDDQDVGPCQTLPEDFDGHMDEDGCPEPDNDGDLVPDLDDACPDEAATFGEDQDDDGCNDPHLDADADGVEDASDLCGLDAEDRDGHADEDGCPDLDDDEDTIPDAADACPRAAEDRDDHDDADGCPDPDDDRDGVLDADDRCPAEAETIDGRLDTDGCPDRGGRSIWRRTGTPGQPDFALETMIRFARDGVIPEDQRPVIDQLVQHLRAAWGSRFRISIGRGTDAMAAGLRAALESRGVALDAIEIVNDPAIRTVRVAVLP